MVNKAEKRLIYYIIYILYISYVNYIYYIIKREIVL